MNILDEIISEYESGVLSDISREKGTNVRVAKKMLTQSLSANFLPEKKALIEHGNESLSQSKETFTYFVYGVKFVPGEGNKKKRVIERIETFQSKQHVYILEQAVNYACDALERYPITFISEDKNIKTCMQNIKFEYSKIDKAN